MDADAIAAIAEATDAEDLQALAAAKKRAREAMEKEPSAENIEAFRKAAKAVKEFMRPADPGERVFRNRIEALKYLKAQGYAIEKSKLYADHKNNLVKLQADKSITMTELERYIKRAGLEKPADQATDGASQVSLEKQRHEADLQREMARERKRRNDVADGLLMPREQVHLELAGRAVALEAGFKHDISLETPAIMEAADAIADKTERNQFIASRLHDLVDRRLNEYANAKTFLATIMETEALEEHVEDQAEEMQG